MFYEVSGSWLRVKGEERLWAVGIFIENGKFVDFYTILIM